MLPLRIKKISFFLACVLSFLAHARAEDVSFSNDMVFDVSLTYDLESETVADGVVSAWERPLTEEHNDDWEDLRDRYNAVNPVDKWIFYPEFLPTELAFAGNPSNYTAQSDIFGDSSGVAFFQQRENLWSNPLDVFLQSDSPEFIIMDQEGVSDVTFYNKGKLTTGFAPDWLVPPTREEIYRIFQVQSAPPGGGDDPDGRFGFIWRKAADGVAACFSFTRVIIVSLRSWVKMLVSGYVGYKWFLLVRDIFRAFWRFLVSAITGFHVGSDTGDEKNIDD